MRMDRSQRQTAADLVNELPEEELARLIYRYGEERFARRIAAAIVRAREKGRITRSSQLGEIVTSAAKTRSHPAIHPATRTFQALRIAVNQELDGLEEFITPPSAMHYLLIYDVGDDYVTRRAPLRAAHLAHARCRHRPRRAGARRRPRESRRWRRAALPG